MLVMSSAAGAMQLPGPGVFGPPGDRYEALAVLRRARGDQMSTILTLGRAIGEPITWWPLGRDR
jgi:hypothetical protein